MLYFDHNATTPVLPAARDAWLESTDKYAGNPSSPHRVGQRADAALQAAREQLAAFLSCDANDIVWTSGATESNNMVLHHCAGSLPADAEVWVSGIEHPCVLAAAEFYFAGRVRRIPVHRSGVIELGWLVDKLKHRRPGLVALMAANNETGVLQPWREVLGLCRGQGIPFFCDAAQWVGKLPASGLGECDYVSGCAHKFGGPKGTGFLKCSRTEKLRPLLLGGQQEEGRRAGTENVPGIIAMLAALTQRESLLLAKEQVERLQWRTAFEKELVRALPGSEVVGHEPERLWNTVCVLMPSMDCQQQRWVVKLDRFGYAVSTGSACASGQEKPSHVLAAMGFASSETSRVLRFSSGWETTEADWRNLLSGLQKVNDALQLANS